MEENFDQCRLQRGSTSVEQTRPFVTSYHRRRIVSEPADAFLLVGEDFLDDNRPDSSLGNVSSAKQAEGDFFPADAEVSTDFFCGGFDRGNGRIYPPVAASARVGHLCGDCDRIFTRPERLRQHVLFKHGATMDYGCGQCGKGFGSKVQLTRHLKAHSKVNDKGLRRSRDSDSNQAVSPPPITCGSVPPSMTAQASTPSKRLHKEQGEKRFQCPQCSKRFQTSKDLKRHDVVHTGNREFQCTFCSHRFGRKDHRMRHEKKTHATELQHKQAAVANSSQILSPNQTSPPPSAVPMQIGQQQPLIVTSFSPPDSLVANSPPSRSFSVMTKKQRWRHVSSPSSFRLTHTSPPPHTCSTFHGLDEVKNDEQGVGAASMIMSDVAGLFLKQEVDSDDEVIENKPGAVDGVDIATVTVSLSATGEGTSEATVNEQKFSRLVSASEDAAGDSDGNLFVHDSTLGLVKVVSTTGDGLMKPAGIRPYSSPSPLGLPADETGEINVNGDLDTLLSEMMNDSPLVISSADAEDLGGRVTSCSSSSPLATSMSGTPSAPIFSRSHQSLPRQTGHRLAPLGPLANISPGLPTDGGQVATSALTNSKCSPKLMSDLLTQTKNPVLPSIYIDNSLVVPGPSRQKYSQHHFLQFDNDFMDVDGSLPRQSGRPPPGDGREMAESIFHM